MNATDKAIILIEQLEADNRILRQQLATARAECAAYKMALEHIRDIRSDALTAKPASSIEIILQEIVQAQQRIAREALGGDA